MMIQRVACLAVVLALFSGAGASAAATPTPVPGGANQMKALSGTLASSLFNGQVRIRKMVLRKSTAAEGTADPGGMALTLTYIISDGTAAHQYGAVGAQLADADGVVVNGHPVGVYGAYFSIHQGEAARGTIWFALPAGFTPTKMLVMPPDGPALRIALKPSDLPAVPAPAATVTP